jgi:hypothetical protein
VEQSGLLKGLVGSMSTIPLIKEVLRFLRDFEDENRNELFRDSNIFTILFTQIIGDSSFDKSKI